MKCYSEVELEKTYSDDTNPDEPANEPAKQENLNKSLTIKGFKC